MKNTIGWDFVEALEERLGHQRTAWDTIDPRELCREILWLWEQWPVSSFDTGDHVRHLPSGEEWVVAFVRDDRLTLCGWPMSSALVSDCELIKKDTPEGRMRLLATMAAYSDHSDPRTIYARERLAREQKEKGVHPE